MGWDCKICKNKRFCEEAYEKDELVKCKFEPINSEEVDKFCEDFIKALVDWRNPNKRGVLTELVEMFNDWNEEE